MTLEQKVDQWFIENFSTTNQMNIDKKFNFDGDNVTVIDLFNGFFFREFNKS